MLPTRLLRPAASSSSIRFARQGSAAASHRLFHATAASRAVHDIKTVDEFRQVVKVQDKVLVDCTAAWCGPCKVIAPILEKLSDEVEFKGKVHFVKFDVDELPLLSQELGVRAMPTFLFFKDGKKVEEMVGANPSMLLQALRRHNA